MKCTDAISSGFPSNYMDIYVSISPSSSNTFYWDCALGWSDFQNCESFMQLWTESKILRPN